MRARNRVEIGCCTGYTHSLAELVPWNRFLGSLKVEKFGLRIYLLQISGKGAGAGLCKFIFRLVVAQRKLASPSHLHNLTPHLTID
jgi:hypothetical protein